MKNLLKIMTEVYGAGPGIFDPAVILWSTEKLATQIDADLALAEMRKLNLQRARFGLIPATFNYGHSLFKTEQH
jgi:hypothetical protein